MTLVHIRRFGIVCFIVLLARDIGSAASAKSHPCRPNPCFNGGHCFRVANNTRTFQCRCRPEYVGERCEATDKSMSAVGVLCEDKEEAQSTLDFTCPPSTVITVEYAAYGLPSNESSMACRHGVGTERACAFNGSLTEVMQLCHHTTQCSLPPVKTIFSRVDRPCKAMEGETLALEYRFRCQLADTESISLTSQMSPIDALVQHNETASPACMEATDHYENGFCYRIHYVDDRSKRKSWNDARAQCASHGGDLAGSITAELHEKLSQRMKSLDERRVKYFWIGARIDVSAESDSETVARWTSGAELDYLPEGSKLDEGECVVYYIQPGRSHGESRSVWLAKSCSLYYNWICQFPVGVASDTTTMSVEHADPVTTTESISTAASSRVTRPSRPSTFRPPHRPTKVPVLGRNRTRITPETPAATTTTSKPTPEITTIAETTTRRTTTEPTTMEVTTTASETTVDTTVASTTERTTSTWDTTTVEMETTTVPAASVFESTAHGLVDFGTEDQLKEKTRRPAIVISPTLRIADRKTTSSDTARIRIKVPGSGRPAWAVGSTPRSTGEQQIDSTPIPVNDKTFWEAISTPKPLSVFGGYEKHSEIITSTATTVGAETEATEPTAAPGITVPTTDTTMTTDFDRRTNDRVTILGAGVCEPTRERGIAWPSTREGVIADKPCPVGLQGTAKWECRRLSDRMRFFPSHPDLSDCHHVWFQEIDRQVSNGRYAMKIADDLHRYLTTSNLPLYGGDIKRSLAVMDKLFELQAKQLWEQNKEPEAQERLDEALKFSQHIGTIIDFFMSVENTAGWRDLLLHDRMVELSLLMQLVEENASFLARFMLSENSTKLDFTNYAMKVEVRKTAHKVEGAPYGGGSYAVMTAHPNPIEPANAPDAFTTAWTSEPNSDAVGSQSSSDGEFSMQDDAALIVLPSRGVLAVANHDQENNHPGPVSNHRSLSDAASAFAFYEQKQDQDDLLRLAYFVYTRNLNTLLQPPNFDLAEQEQVGETERRDGLGWSRRVTVVNSRIIGAVVNEPQQRVAFPEGQNVTVTLKHLVTGTNVENARCVYWNLEQHSWDTDGCEIANSTSESTVCTCNHLTSFAILMDINGEIEGQPGVHRNVLKYLTMAGCALSAACLGISVLVFTCFRSLWSVRNSVHRNLCLTLLIGELLFLFGVDETRNKDVCTVIAAALHYFFLAAFCWMFMEGYQLYTMLVRVFEPPELSQLIGYYVVSYGAPAVVVAVSVGLGRQHYGTGAYCWINAGSPVVWAFVGPVALVTLANMIFLAVALKVACGVNTAENRSKAAKIKGWLKGSTMLLCLLGLTWVFGFFFVIRPATVYFAYIFTVMNSLQGVFIFTFHVVLNEKVHGAIAKWFKRHGHCLPNYYSVSTKSGGSSSESKHWPSHLTASTTAASFGFSNTVAASGMAGYQNDQREMMERRAAPRGSACRRRGNDRYQQSESESMQRGRQVLGQSRRENGYLAGDDEGGKNSRALPVQIVHRTFDDDSSPAVHSTRPHAILPVNDTAARFPIVKALVPSYENGTPGACRHMLFISTGERDSGRPYQADSRKEPVMNRFYYSSDAAAVVGSNGKAYQTTIAACSRQKFIERF